MLTKGNQPQLKQLRDLDLNSIDKPKTLVILHYNNTRISVPLFKQVSDLPDLLYHHISTLQQQILKHHSDWQKRAHQQIVCFQIKKQTGKKTDSSRVSDGDLRSDIMLSMLRLKGQQQIEELSFKMDVTKIYKYLQVQPFYRQLENDNRFHPLQKNSFLRFHRLLQTTNNSNCYLARRITDGYFLTVKVFAERSKVGLSEARVLDHMAYIDQQGSPTKISLLLRTQTVACIPHPESESSEEQDTPENCQHVAVLYPHMVRGTLQQLLQETRFGRRRVSEMDCLNYLKQLMWGMHLLHEKYNLLHRALTPSNILIDQNGQLKLGHIAFSVPCFDSQGQFAEYSPRTRYPKDGFSLEQLLEEDELEIQQYCAPQLLHGQSYNHLVDFYSVGRIIRKLYEQTQLQERAPVNQNNQSLMMAMIEKLTSNNVQQRSSIVHEILEDIARQDLEEESQNSTPSLVLQEIKVGKAIEITEDKKFIENQQFSNGIIHSTIFNFFQQPPKPKIAKPKKMRKVSKDKAAKGSRQKSEKSHSKVSELSQTKKRKLSNNSKNKSFNNSQDMTKNSREKYTTIKNVLKESPAKKVNKSKSQERKKDPLTCTKVFSYHPEDQKKIIGVVPKSPKAGTFPHRLKSPGMREK